MSDARPFSAALLAAPVRGTRPHGAPAKITWSGGRGASPITVGAGTPTGRPASHVRQMRPPFGRQPRRREMGGKGGPCPPRRKFGSCTRPAANCPSSPDRDPSAIYSPVLGHTGRGPAEHFTAGRAVGPENGPATSTAERYSPDSVFRADVSAHGGGRVAPDNTARRPVSATTAANPLTGRRLQLPYFSLVFPSYSPFFMFFRCLLIFVILPILVVFGFPTLFFFRTPKPAGRPGNSKLHGFFRNAPCHD